MSTVALDLIGTGLLCLGLGFIGGLFFAAWVTGGDE